MKTKTLLTLLSLLALFILSSCGYRSPYVYSGPDKNIYITSWKNRTSQLQLESDIYQSLIEWYQKSDSLRIVKSKDQADLILAGEILSINLPSLSYGANSTTREVKIQLKVRYILKDIKTEKVLFQQPGQIRFEDYIVDSNPATNADNEKEALDTIIDELSQDLYVKTLNKLSKM